MFTVRGVSLYQGVKASVRDIDFQVNKNDIVTIMGPSGSGKSSLLSWIIGALPPRFQASGELWFNERRIDTLPAAQRQISILFQDALPFDHFSVRQNLLLALSVNLQGPARRYEIECALVRADLVGFYSRDLASLSSGQRSRVTLLRALLAQPQALLLDEPFSRLDVSLRDNFRQQVLTEVRKLGIPVIQVTHDAQDVPPAGRVFQMENQV